MRTFLQSSGVLILGDIDPDLDDPTALCVTGRKHQSDPVICRLFLPLEDTRIEHHQRRAIDRLGTHKFRTRPDHRDTQGKGYAQGAHGEP